MGQKTRPAILRIGINKTWNSRWYGEGEAYINFLHEDLKIRKYIDKEYRTCGISKIIIERSNKLPSVTIHTSRPGLIIGRKGSDIESMKKKLFKLIGKEVKINIFEVRKPEVDAKIVAVTIAQQLEKRASFRRVMKKSIQAAMRLGAKGIRINCSGRLSGVEIARMEWYREGRIPLHTLRADIDYGIAEANTTYGVIGVKVWLYKGDIYKGSAYSKTLENNVQKPESSNK